MNAILSKVLMGVLVLVLALSSLPLSNARAAGLTDDPTPPASTNPALNTTRLERMFARQNKILARVTKAYKQLDAGFPKLVKIIEKAKEKGLDVSKVETAFDAFKKALTDARPLYDQAKKIADAHAGFDANGKVTDAATARETIKNLREAGKKYKEAMGGTLKALHEALKNLRDQIKQK